MWWMYCEHYDTITADGTDVTHSRPDQEVFLKAAEKISTKPADCVVGEDSKAGIEAAKSGGRFLAISQSDRFFKRED